MLYNNNVGEPTRTSQNKTIKLERKPYMEKQLNTIIDKNLIYINTEYYSSNIYSISYHLLSKQLFITFKSNVRVLYRYQNVSSEMFLLFITSKSFGKFFCEYIKPTYKCERHNYVNDCWEKVGE